MRRPQKRRSLGGNPGFETADNNNLQAESSSVRGTHGDQVARPLLRVVPKDGEAPSLPVYANEILRQQAAGIVHSYVIFAGADAHQAAFEHQIRHGSGTATALLDGMNPADYRWPAAHRVTVTWPDTSDEAFDRKIALAHALISNGVRYASFTHAPAWRNIWLDAVQARHVRRLHSVPKVAG